MFQSVSGMALKVGEPSGHPQRKKDGMLGWDGKSI
jgi:hypothetical protein